MNYLKELNVFLDRLEMEEMSAGAAILWVSLMHFNNKAGWKKEFALPSMVLMTKARLSETSFKRARKELKEKGYIKHTFVARNRAPVYEMISQLGPEQTAGSAGGTALEPDHGTARGTAPLYKQKEKKQNKQEEADAPLIDPHTFYEQHIGPLNPLIIERITYWCEELSDRLVIEAVKRSVEQNKHFFRYCEAILKRWAADGVKTVADVDRIESMKEKAGGGEDLFEAFRREREQ
ncbi:DnaD domain protein [Halobacillus sp. ACCC02827]|uniref:DnaD domain protein n=1 Tax=Halobacillus sp. ACCC02827 TaxID=3052090 RepID=UPI002570A32D|nr:DnaD domain protein [Halobacillus sp. ACCC02827]WJE15724.1 DnaD domain protein [Halobacillus sp. ACCC02827]